MELREKITAEIGACTRCGISLGPVIADRILAIPEIAEALRLKAHRDTKVGYERQG